MLFNTPIPHLKAEQFYADLLAGRPHRERRGRGARRHSAFLYVGVSLVFVVVVVVVLVLELVEEVVVVVVVVVC